MSAGELLRSSKFDEIGVEHGFGTRHTLPITPTDVVLAKQVHGATLVRAEPGAARPEADALWTDRPGTAVGVVTADCVPILIAHESGRFVCAVHAGWRGSAARIAVRSVRALIGETGCRAEELRAAIGPHIGPCCYEVDGPVLEAIPDPGVYRASTRPGHALLDLFALNRLQLAGSGIPERQIERVGGCTACEPDLYPSYRRDRGSGRLLHFARAR